MRKEEKKEKKEKEDDRPPIERRVPAKGKGKGSVASARPALSKGTSKGKDKDSAVPARQFVTPKPVKEPRAEGYEGDDSDEEPPAKPMSSRPSLHLGQLQYFLRIWFSRGWRRSSSWRVLLRC